MNSETNQENLDCSFLRGGLLHNVLSKIGLSQAGPPGIRKRAGLLIALTYLPLLILCIGQGVAYNPAVKEPFLLDISEACRFLLVGPFLLAADFIIEPWLAQVVKHARERLISPDQLSDFDKLLSGSAAWRDSPGAEIILLFGTFAMQWFDLHLTQPVVTTSWYHLPASHVPTYAWYWHAYFAKPLIRFLWLRWMWWYLLWAVFLVRLSLLKLKIMPTHPDHHGGLAFIAVGHTKFAVLTFAFGVQLSSVLAQQIIFAGRTLMFYRYEILTVAVGSVLVFLTPLLAFTGKLINAKRIGLFECGALADDYTCEFHDKWIKQRGGDKLLGTADIQSLADLGNSYAVVRDMRVFLISKDALIAFVVTPLVPVLPLILTVYPFEVLVSRLLKVVL